VNVDDLIPPLLLWAVLPLWLLAGLGDYFCHRRMRIEDTSGAPESVLHLMEFFLIFVPVLIGLFFTINFLVFACMALAWLLHSAASLWDTSYASRHRTIPPAEQHVHSYLELLPLFALLLVGLLHWDALHAFDLHFVRRTPPLAGPHVVGVIAAMSLPLVPILEEWWRGRRRERADAHRPT
jgi:hypothetical protein